MSELVSTQKQVKMFPLPIYLNDDSQRDEARCNVSYYTPGFVKSSNTIDAALCRYLMIV